MRARILNPEEWTKIDTPNIPEMLMYTEPQNVAVCVVEDGGEIVASVCAIQVTHFEGLFIRPEHRGNAGIFRALIRQAYAVPRSKRERFAFAAHVSGDDKMVSLCQKLGGKPVDVELYALPVGG